MIEICFHITETITKLIYNFSKVERVPWSQSLTFDTYLFVF